MFPLDSFTFPETYIAKPVSDKWLSQGALFSDCNKYRYLLWRQWDDTKPTLAFCMLNPSIADAFILDPTVTRCVNYAKKWGYGELIVLNIFAIRSTDPMGLYSCDDPVGRYNDWIIDLIASKVDKIVAGWGVLMVTLWTVDQLY